MFEIFIIILIISILSGILFSFLLASVIVSVWLYKSNDSGNSVASFSDFTQQTPLYMLEARDRVSLPPGVSSVSALLNILK